MDEWMNGWMDEWMNGWMDEWMNGWMDEWMNGWMDEWMNGWWMNEWIKNEWQPMGIKRFIPWMVFLVYGRTMELQPNTKSVTQKTGKFGESL